MRIAVRHHPSVLRSLAACALAACGGGSYGATGPGPDPTPVMSATVVASGSANAFSPTPVRLLVGGTVTWSFSTRAHNVTFDTRTGAPANIPTTTGATVSRSFAVAGTFPYQCTVHPGMQGSIVVQ